MTSLHEFKRGNRIKLRIRISPFLSTAYPSIHLSTFPRLSASEVLFCYISRSPELVSSGGQPHVPETFPFLMNGHHLLASYRFDGLPSRLTGFSSYFLCLHSVSAVAKDAWEQTADGQAALYLIPVVTSPPCGKSVYVDPCRDYRRIFSLVNSFARVVFKKRPDALLMPDCCVIFFSKISLLSVAEKFVLFIPQHTYKMVKLNMVAHAWQNKNFGIEHKNDYLSETAILEIPGTFVDFMK